MTKRIKILGPDDLPPWTFIRPPTIACAITCGTCGASLVLSCAASPHARRTVVCRCPVMDAMSSRTWSRSAGGERDDVIVSCERAARERRDN